MPVKNTKKKYEKSYQSSLKDQIIPDQKCAEPFPISELKTDEKLNKVRQELKVLNVIKGLESERDRLIERAGILNDKIQFLKADYTRVIYILPVYTED